MGSLVRLCKAKNCKTKLEISCILSVVTGISYIVKKIQIMIITKIKLKIISEICNILSFLYLKNHQCIIVKLIVSSGKNRISEDDPKKLIKLKI